MPRLQVRDVPGIGRLVKVSNVRMPNGRYRSYLAQGRDALKEIFDAIAVDRRLACLRSGEGSDMSGGGRP